MFGCCRAVVEVTVSSATMSRAISVACARRERLVLLRSSQCFALDVLKNDFVVRTPLRALGRLPTRLYDVGGMKVV